MEHQYNFELSVTENFFKFVESKGDDGATYTELNRFYYSYHRQNCIEKYGRDTMGEYQPVRDRGSSLPSHLGNLLSDRNRRFDDKWTSRWLVKSDGRYKMKTYITPPFYRD